MADAHRAGAVSRDVRGRRLALVAGLVLLVLAAVPAGSSTLGLF